MPFYALDSDSPARVVIEQLDARRFRVVDPFRYVEFDAHGDPVAQFVVPDPRWADETTDLASVPSVLLWVVPRYGRHTLPAILHDQILRHDLVDQPERADRIFRNAMGEQRVALVMRWMMWAAVSMRTIWSRRRWILGPMIVWFVLWAAVAYRVTPPFAAWHEVPFVWLVAVPWWVAVATAVLGPLVLGLAWPHRYLVGVMSGYGAFLFAVPLTAVVLALAVYRALEKLLERFDTAKRPADGKPVPPAPASADVLDRTSAIAPGS
jgi:hypothetical protein